MTQATARLGPLTFAVDPLGVKWNFRMRVNEHETVGGRVIQVSGTDLGDMTVRATMGNGFSADQQGWEALARFRTDVEDLAEASARDRNPTYRFTVPVMNWAFDVQIKSFSPVVYSNESDSPEFTMILFIVQDVTGRVVRGVQDRYIERLTKGIGWARSEYNGPTEDEINDMLAEHEGNAGMYYRDAFMQNVTAVLGDIGGIFGDSDAPPDEGPGGIMAFMWGLREVESNQDYKARNPNSTASGAYQYIDSTWGGYRGYSRAYQAPARIQDEKAHSDISGAYARTKNWRNVAAFWLTGQDNPPNWDARPGHSSNPTINNYVNSVISAMGRAPRGG